MKLATALCVATASLVCFTISAGEITSDQLTEAFLSYTQKAEKVTPDAATLAKMREELAKAKADPLFHPFTFDGGKPDRDVLMEQIAKGLRAWNAANIRLNKTAEFASDTANLKRLSDAELVMAFRLVDQVVSKQKPGK